MKNIEFTESERDKLIEEISKLYYNRNFGSTPKADIDVLMFSAYIEHCIENKKPYDDYTLSKALGITQARIRTLKEKKQLKYPREFSWEEAFARDLLNAKYDKNTNNIKMIIKDINVMNEIRNYIEEKGWYDECSLNKKLLVISLDCFVEICFKNHDFEEIFSDEVKKKIAEIEKSDLVTKAFLENFTKKGMKNFLANASAEIIKKVVEHIPVVGGVMKILLEQFIKIKGNSEK